MHEAHHQYDQVEFHEKELLPFYDPHLKGIDNGFMDGAPVRIFVRGAERLARGSRMAAAARAATCRCYLRKGPSGSVTSLNDGGLSTDAAGRRRRRHAATPIRTGSGRTAWSRSARTGGPIRCGACSPSRRRRSTADIEVTGPIVLKLFASSDQIDTRFIVKLADQHPQDEAARRKAMQPASTNVSKGWLKASHREKDAARSTALRPFYTHANPQPLTPARSTSSTSRCCRSPTCSSKGHRIRLEIVNGDSPLTDAVFTHPYHPTLIGTDTIHHDAAHASCILLPVIDDA